MTRRFRVCAATVALALPLLGLSGPALATPTDEPLPADGTETSEEADGATDTPEATTPAAPAEAPAAETPAADAAASYDVPQDGYSVLDVSSESNPYPAPPALDGTAAAAIDGDYATQWTSRYVESAPYPHWIVLDIGATLPLTALDYSVKPNQNGVAGNVEVYVTDDLAVASDPEGDWGAPAGTATLVNPTSASQRQRIAFGEVVEGRYVKFVMVTPLRANAPAGSASELVVLSTQEPTGPQPVETVTLTDGAGFEVDVATAFPQIVSYDVDGVAVAGQSALLNTFRINGQNAVASTTMTHTQDTASYVSTIPSLGLTITSTIAVGDGRTAVLQVTGITGGSVQTLSIPDHVLLSATSATPGVELARTTIDVNSNRNADRFIPITGTTAVDANPVNAALAFLDVGDVVGGVLTNGSVDSPSGTSWNQQLITRIAGTDERQASIATAQWTYQPAGATDPRVTPYALPSAVVYFADDLNGADGATWQDAAIRYRELVPAPLGADRVADRVVDRIPFNIVSHATNPFQLTLDNTLRIANSTDFLGQFVLEKGYGNEGHDSANSDYGGNYNLRTGDLEGLNELVDQGNLLNADFYVHVNATEAYPQANSFSDTLITQPPSAGWNWMNQSYYINQRTDLGSGAVVDRFAQLNEEVPGLDGVYIDVYYSTGWLADGLAAELNEMGLEVGSEWADKFFESSVWAHWPNDLNYGGSDNKGINSQMIRFIQNSRTDLWNDDPLLGSQRLVDAEGWGGNQDWNAFYDNVWARSLPTKFVQHFELLDWDLGVAATLSDGVHIELQNGIRVITLDGVEVLRGEDYLLPWQSVQSADETSSPLAADKMYFYTADGGERTFDLTSRFAGVTSFDVYALGDTGRELVDTVSSNGSTLTLTGEAGVAYVVVPAGDAQLNDPGFDYGVGSPLTDPGFNSGTLAPWSPQGEVDIERTEFGDNVAVVGAGASSLGQEISGLQPGTRYTFSSDVEIETSAAREVTLSVTGAAQPASNSFTLTPALNWVGSDARRGTYSQRASVAFVAPASGTVTVQIAVGAGSNPVTLDATRVMVDTSTPTPDGVVLAEDFEGNQPGWGPFVKGDSGGYSDARTSVSWLHSPYTDKTWKNTAYPHQPGGPQPGTAVDDVLNGQHSLKLHDQQPGLTMRTVPATVTFEEGHRYQVSFSYQASNGGQFHWVTGADALTDGELGSTVLTRTPLPQALQTTSYSGELVAGCGSTWVGIERTSGAASDLIIDDLRIVDLGEDPSGAACATLSTGPATLSPGSPSTLTTTFTNSEDATVTDVWLGLQAPQGWSVKVADGSANLIEAVEPGESVAVTWVVTAPSTAAGTTATLQASAQYLYDDCLVRTLESPALVQVATRARIPNSQISVTANSENLTSGDREGPAALVLDNDPGTIWHSQYSPTAASYPYVLTFDLGSVQNVDGLGYLRRAANVNGPIKDYVIEVSTNGTTWTEVSRGAFANVAPWQDVSFTAVQARHVRFTATSSISGNQFGAAAEIAIYGTGAVVAGHDPLPRPQPPTGCDGQPTLTLDPAQVAPGGSVDVELAGFEPDTDVALWLGETELSTVSVGADGTAAATVTVPTSQPAGTVLLQARSGGQVLASASLTVTPPASVVVAGVTARCLAGKAYLYLSARNTGAAPVAVTVHTPYGDKTFPSVAPGQVGAAALNSRLAQIPAGTTTFTVTEPDGSTRTLVVEYAALSCAG